MKRSKLLLVIATVFLLLMTVSCNDTSDSHIHKFSSWEITTAPTMTEKGQAVKSCECGRELKIAIANLSDTTVWTEKEEERVEPTCATQGSATYGSIYGSVTITLETVDHEYGEWEITQAPTKDATGEAVRVCKYGEEDKVTLPVLTDTTVWTFTKTVAPTCVDKGYDAYSSIYGEVHYETVEATGHTYGKWNITTEPTTTTEGVAYHACHCEAKEEVTLPVLTDETVWTVTTTAATCTENGQNVYSSVYGTVTVVIEAAGHTYGKWNITTEPTTTTEGVAYHACHCEAKEEVTLPVLTDDTVWTVAKDVPATYNENGSKTYTSIYGEVEIVLTKLVAPYDGKTYSNLSFDADNDNGGFKNGVVSVGDSWHKATVTFDNLGKGEASAFPFRGLNIVKMVNSETGLIEYSQVSYKSDSEGNMVLNYDDATKYTGYVDFASGIIIRTYRNNFNNVLLLTPFEAVASSASALASSWDNAMAIQYTYNETVYNIFIYKEVVYFGVTFEDAAGQTVKANACYNAPYLYVKDSKGQLIEGFGYNGTKEVVLDGFEGTYASGDDTLVVSGFGTATYNDVKGTYTFAEGETFTAHLYAGDAYYEVTLDKETKAVSVVKPMVEITFNGGSYATIEPVSVNKNISYALPALTHESYAFKGWFYDEEFTKAVAEEFVPTVSVTLYAKWVKKVAINLVGVLEGDPTLIYVAVGDAIGDALPKYTIVEEKLIKFVGWYLDENYETALTETGKVSEEEANSYVYAKWEKLPAYYGSYKGNEIWGTTSGNNSNCAADLKIDAEGNITGKFTGKVVSYDPTTQKITWQKSNSSKNYGLWFDEASGVIATQYSSQDEIGTDYYLFSKGQTTNLFEAHYGINCTKPSATLTGNYFRLVTLTTTKGVQTILTYGDRIYSNIVVTDTAGQELTTSTVKNSKTVVVRDATTSEIIVALASIGDNFGKNSKSQTLDKYFGSYTCENGTAVLDGTGVITYMGKTGTYTAAPAGSEYSVDAYLSEKSEYYQITLNGTECVVVKPTVEITFVVGEGHTAVSPISANINVALALPDATEENYVFNGWFYDQEFKKAVPSSFVPTVAVTLYAKHSNPADLTIVYNNGEENKVVRYSVGDVVTLDTPVYAKHMFINWYTTPEFTEGTVWTNKSTIETNLTIYAKWEVAPAYNNTYLPIEVYGDKANGDESRIYTRTYAVVTIDPYGKAPSTGYPFSGGVVITDFDATTGTLTITSGSTVYKGYIDVATGIIFISYKNTTGATLGEVIFLDPFSTKTTSSSFSSSYWDAGMTRAIQYTYDGTTYSYFVFNGKVYMNVSFKDAEGNGIAGKLCYTAPVLFVYASDGTLIAKFGYDGTTMQKLDGYEGTYTNGEENTVVLNGIDQITLNGVKGTYSIAKDAIYTIDAYVNNTYYEVTLNVSDHTYTSNKPMVEIVFNTDEKVEVATQSLNKNIKVTLPVIDTEGFIFRGWYLDSEFKNAVSSEYTPTESLTLYAKWDVAAILTTVYGNGIETTKTKYGVGDKVQPIQPIYTNGLVFDGWYLDSDYAEEYEETTISTNTTIYCKWKEAIALYGKYTGFEVYGFSATYVNFTNGKEITVDALGNASSTETNLKGTIVDYDPETGNFKLKSSTGALRFGYFDVEHGIIAVNYTYNTDDLGNDQYILFVNMTRAQGDKTKSYNLEGGKARFVTVTDSGDASTEIVIFVYGTKVYANPTFTGAESLAKAASAEEFSVFDSEGNLIAKFNKGAIVK